jgi:putative FmdB family regulatory protein
VPTYGYECNSCKERFEVFQKITEEPLTIHDGCGGQVRRLLYPVGIVFKGSGFYVNDYSKKTGTTTETGTETKSEAAAAPVS